MILKTSTLRNRMNIADEITRTVAATIETELADDFTSFTAEQLLSLSASIDAPEFGEQLGAASVNVALRARPGNPDDLDPVLVATITGALAVGARALV